MDGHIVNHSCEPNVAFDLSSEDQNEWHVRALKTIREGETRKCLYAIPATKYTDHLSTYAQVTFFYPSTEWDMAQPFDCICGTPVRSTHSFLL